MATKRESERALEQYSDTLTRLKNVVGVGIVPTEESEGKPGRKDLAVAVYVSKKLPPSRLREKDLVPETLAVQTSRGEVQVPTRVIEQGPVELEGPEAL